MNTKEFTSELSRRIGRNVKETTSLIKALTDEIASQLSEGNNISIQSFGNFEVKKKLEHVVVNPGTRQRMLVPPKMEIKFKPSPLVKEKIN